ncbi:related to translation initiation factor IF-2, mitochondrial [Melanopsichium pennsylvanicum]|uniref:Related to translation initiation factor IF-2, mitochondrial n=2 Tax=Melanopsichium pennsylvanicum TaxID=63383 RepID=A0AAJ5C4F9_9BASI|nr:related to translation initiation factor IF-2, mitochondrial [Melanopsichium pennsylvanicum 4]SNX83503.1 related to translation initiation factor IF-2, mitochondrial [Melanopsichium pennsylvanicum]
MLSRTSFLANSSRLASWAAASNSSRVTAATFSTPLTLSRSLSFTSSVSSSRTGDPSASLNRNNDRSDHRPRRRDDAFSFNQRSDGSNAGNPVQQYSRNQRFAPDGSRKRLPHPNARPRSNQSQGQNRDGQRPPRPKDGTPRNNINSERRHSQRFTDESAFKFGASSTDGSASSSAAAKVDSTVSRLRARNASSSEDGAVGSHSRDTGRFSDSDGAVDVEGSARAGDEAISQGKKAVEKSDRHHIAKQKKKEGRGSLLDPEADHEHNHRRSSQPSATFSRHSRHQPTQAEQDILSTSQGRQPAPAFKPKLLPKVTRNVFLPSVISVVMLAMRMEKKLGAVKKVMNDLGMQDTRPDLMLKFEDAEMIAAELNIVAIPNDEASFDLYPRPPPSTPEEAASFPLRPPVVTIMGHVDHGKTTLLDKLRSTSVAQGEAGGITQHIGAFSVPIAGRLQDKGKQKGYKGIQTITFLDTPGHAAFTAMRSRGAMVTDIVVLVVAADDGVMPQTREVIQLVKNANADIGASDDVYSQPPVQMIVALNKIDKPDADADKVKRELLAAGVELEELGGDIPCVHVSGKTGRGLDELEETIATLAELSDLRAERIGLPEGYVIESKVDKGRGNVATVLVKRGVLEKSSCVVAGKAWCKVRQILHSSGRPLAKAFPGDPVLVTGWRNLPTAGDLLIGGMDEASCKKATENRKQAEEQKRLMADVEQINQARRIKAEQDEMEARKEFEERQRRRAARLAADDGKDPLAALAAMEEEAAAKPSSQATAAEEVEANSKEEAVSETTMSSTDSGKKYLNVIVKADYSGTVEAVVGAISSIGNAEAGVKIISASVGEPSESDISRASALGATIIGFNVTPSKSVLQSAARAQPTPVPLISSDVIYRLMETVTSSVSSLLAPLTEARVQGEALVSQIFDINIKGKNFKKIAGCKVTNGTMTKLNMVRVLRGSKREQVFVGKMDEFKHIKKDVVEMRKGTECGMSFQGWQDLKVGDVVQSFTEVSVPRTL